MRMRKSIFNGLMIFLLTFGYLVAPTQVVQAAPLVKATALVLVNSASASYSDFQEYIQPYLDHFGIPYTVLDIASSTVIADVGDYAVILTGHKQLDTNLTYLSAAEQTNLVNAVNNGSGLVNFDNDLSGAGGAPRYDFIQSIFGFTYGAGALASDVTFSAAPHYITERHSAGETIPTGDMSLAGISLIPGDVTSLVNINGQPFLAAAAAGNKHAVQWGSYDWMSHSVKGPLFGFDDMVWRSIVWAARKPFVMQGLLPFVTMRMDDTSGPLWWIHTANEYGFIPWAGVFTDDFTAAEAADLSGLVNSGKATATIHGFGSSNFFYYDGPYGGSNFSDAQMAANYATATQWFLDNNIPISKYVVPHFYEIGSNAFGGLTTWGTEFVGTMMAPGNDESGTPWLMEAPFRLYETGDASERGQNPYYADFLTIPGHPEMDGEFFNCITEIRDVTGYEWLGNGRTSVPQAIADGIEWLKRPLDSMALATLFSHEYTFINAMSQANWRAAIEGITQAIAPYDPIYASMEDACQYVRAMRTSNITASSYDADSRVVITTLGGSTDLPTKFYLFTDDNASIQQILLDVPQFNETANVTYTLPGALDHITISPANPNVVAGAAQQFTAQGFDAANAPIPGLDFTWSVVNGGGSIGVNGLFTAGAVTGTFTDTIQASFNSINAVTSVAVVEATLDHFVIDTVNSPRYANQPFPLTVRAVDVNNNPVVTFTGQVALTASAGSAAPSTTANFVNGVWTGNVTLSQAGNGVTLTATSTTFSGTSNSFDVLDSPACPCSVWTDATTPGGSTNENDNQPLEIGVKFRSDLPGLITGIKFYRSAQSTGTHEGHLWSSDGTLLASVTFSSLTASGWQTAYFDTPVQISPDTTYIASYHTDNYYAQDTNYFGGAGIDTPPLHALADGEDGANGVYVYGASGTFPTNTYQSSNYWVDVVFDMLPTQTYSVWNDATTPAAPAVTDSVPIEVGFRFQSAVAGRITGVRFYKGAPNQGNFTGNLWTDGGVNLASAAYTNNTTDVGWQDILFAAPVAINANTTYVASYFSPSGYFAMDQNYFTTAHENPPLTALQDTPSTRNGLFLEPGPGFPTGSYNSSNYWVDVLFLPDAAIDNTPPTVSSVSPATGASGVNVNANISAVFGEALSAATISGASFELRDSASTLVPAAVTYNNASRTAQLNPDASLAYSTTYTATLKGGASGITDLAGNPLTSDYTWSFTTAGAPPPPPDEGPGGPILVVAWSGNPFTRYYAEILRAEGLNAFTVTDITNVDAALLSNYDVVILGEMPLSAAQVTLVSDWVNAGGNLIAMRPDKALAGLLGLTDAGGTQSNGYIAIHTASGPGQGIVSETIQYHGVADRYTLNGATALAGLYFNATTFSGNPAVSLIDVGTNGGQAAAFAFDLARSVVYTRQGNPDWAGDERDGVAPRRSDDLFFGAKTGDVQADWVDFNKIAIPQADEQQRFLANLILSTDLDQMPLPRFWYLPRGEKAAVVMTSDDHGGGDIVGRLNRYKALSPAGCSVDDWECVRSSPYIYTYSQINNAQAVGFTNDGFEIALHLNTNCNNYTPASLEADFTAQLGDFASTFPGLPAPSSHRTHCVVWSDWGAKPQVELNHGIRLNTDYYYWPPAWVNDRPGLFTGSAMPMRFALEDGSMVDVYQATTQMTDESGQSYPFTIDTLLDRAVGTQGYYGVYTANIHTDAGAVLPGSEAIVASAQARGVPVVSGRQMLEWLDGRNGSSFQALNWDGTTLDFTVSVGSGANGLQVMLPAQSATGSLTGITQGGNPVTYTTETIKGMQYALFQASAAAYEANYGIDATAPVISNLAATPGTGGNAVVTWDTDETSDSLVEYGLDPALLNLNASDAALVTAHTVQLSGLAPSTTYYYRVTSKDAANNSAVSPEGANPPASFTTPALATELSDTSAADFNLGSGDCVIDPAIGDGALRLTDALLEYFSGSVLPAGWTNTPWTGGASVVGGGLLTVDGASARYDTLYNPGRTLEFEATFGSQAFQHVGFGGGDPTFNDSPWAMFSTSNDGAQLYARVLAAGGTYNTGDDKIPLGAQYLGSQHRYRIDWRTDGVDFSIDGTVVASRPVVLATPMRVAASDYNNGGGSLTVDWLRVSPPYVSPCTFTSRVLDAGQAVNWNSIVWTGDVPVGTSSALSYRFGSTSNLSGEPWVAVTGSSPATLNATSRYIQYQVVLATTDIEKTAALRDVTFTYNQNDTLPPSVTGRSPSPGATNIPLDTNVTATFDEALDPATVTAAVFTLRADGSAVDIPAGVAYSGTTATLDPTSNLSPGVLYHVTVSGGAGGVADLAGNPLAADDTWSFTTLALPAVTDHQPAPGAVDMPRDASITATFSRPMDAATITNATFTLRADGGGSDVPAVVTYSGLTATLDPVGKLDAGTLYHVTVSAVVADPAGYTLAGDDTWSFTTSLYDSAADTSVADFESGTAGVCAVVQTGNGELSLAPTAGTEFSGAALSPGWEGAQWGAGSGLTISGGVLTLDNAYARTTTLYGPGRALEFVATFSNQSISQNEHVGFGNTLNESPWAVFSTTYPGSGSLWARSNYGSGNMDTDLGGAYLGGSHRFRIEWYPTHIVYLIDGVQVADHAVVIADNMRPIASDGGDAATLTVDWMRMSPFASPCAFESRVVDAGAPVHWLQLTSTNELPSGSAVGFETRAGNTATPDASWSVWQAVGGSGAIASPGSRYIQYRAALSSSNSDVTPLVEQVTITYSANQAPTAADNTLTGLEDTDLLFAAGDFNFADSDPGDAFVQVQITALETAGTLYLDENNDGVVDASENVALDQIIAAADFVKLKFKPAANAFGVPYTSFTFKVSDGVAFSASSYSLTINITPVNDAPTISDIADQNTNEDTPVGPVSFTVGDVEDAPADLVVTATSSNTTLLPDANIALGGSGANRTITLTPAANQSGTATITVTVTDSGSATGVDTFVLTVSGVNDAPTISDIADQNTNEDTPLGPLGFTVGDAEDTPADLIVTATSSNTTLLPDANIALGGSGANRTITLTPAANQSGAATVTVTVTDSGSATGTDTFVLTVGGVNDAPTISDIADQNTSEDTPVGPVSFTVGDAEDAPADLVVTAVSSNQTLLPDANIALGGSGANRTITLTPALNRSGTATVTVTVTDIGSATAVDTFVLTVSGVNDAPTDIALSNDTLAEGGPAGTVVGTLTTTDLDLSDTFTYSLVDTAGCAGPDNAFFQIPADELQTALPLDYETQSTYTICIRSTDGGGLSVDKPFTITVTNLNDPPINQTPGAQNLDENTVLTFSAGNGNSISISDADAGANEIILTLTATNGLLSLSGINGLVFTMGTGSNDGRMTFIGTLSDINAALEGMTFTPPNGFNGTGNLVIDTNDLGFTGPGGAQSDVDTVDITVGAAPPRVITGGIGSIPDTGDGKIDEWEIVTQQITQLLVTFDQDVYDPLDSIPMDPNDVNNPDNYRLYQPGANGGFEVATCAATGIITDDVPVIINNVSYTSNSGAGPFTATLSVNNQLPLPSGSYRLIVCGTTSITDINDITLKLAGDGVNPGTDLIRNFFMRLETSGGGVGGVGGSGGGDPDVPLRRGLLIPVTGFAPGQITRLPEQPAEKAYSAYSDMILEIPSLGVRLPIVGVPVDEKSGWDVTWLGNNAGYLAGTAFPTWAGNTVLTAHVWDANNNPGPFARIRELKYGDIFRIYAWGKVYTYEVRDSKLVISTNLPAMIQHEELDWVTLATCEEYNLQSFNYSFRRLVRAVLVSVGVFFNFGGGRRLAPPTLRNKGEPGRGDCLPKRLSFAIIEALQGA